MEQHPVPQNISSYQFHLVGDMTLKQFLELAGGVVVGVLIYALGLPGIIKWPLIFISVIIGAALAFIPLEERPLEQWIFAFFRSVYSPTLFHWEKKTGVKYFQDENLTAPALAVAGQTVASRPFSAISKLPLLNKLDESENNYLSKLAGLFNPMSTLKNTAEPPSVLQTNQSQTVQIHLPQPSVTPIQPTQRVANQGEVITQSAANTNFSPGMPFTQTSPTSAGQRTVNIPQTTYVSMDKSARPQVVVEETANGGQNTSQTTTAVNNEPIKETLTTMQTPLAVAAVFSPDAAPPSDPTIKNTVSGQVMDANKKIVEGAILEILDEAGRAVRALKTNKAGHFLIVTPLMNGLYKIVIEKEGYSFDPVEFEAKGEIIQPIAIQAKA